MRWILTLAVFLLLSCSRSPKEKGYEIFYEMVHAVPVEAFSESSLTKDGKAMLTPVEGTIARGKLPYYYEKGDEGAALAGRQLKSPLVVNEATLRRGKALYENYCLVCHGVGGEGDGPLIPKFPNPPSFKTRRLKTYPEGRIYHVITVGSGLMPEHATQILPKDRWAIVHYVKELQKE